jgi:hypothetical protein
MRTARGRLSARATLSELVVTMSEGYSGSEDVLLLIFEHARSPLDVILSLDDMNMRGPQIWHAFHNVCDGRIGELIRRVTEKDARLVAAVNIMTLGEPEQAIQKGASYRHLRS